MAQEQEDPASQEDDEEWSAAEPFAIDGEDVTFFSFLDKPHRAVSSGLRSFAGGIDEFFAEEKVYYETSGSYIRLTADTLWEEGGHLGFAGDILLKIRLPRTQEKMKLTLETNPAEKRDDINRVIEDEPVAAAQEKEYFAGVQSETQTDDKEKWRFSKSFSLKVHRPPDYLARFRIDKTTTLGSWLHSFNQTFFWFNSSGYGSSTSYDMDRKIGDDKLFRSATYARWTEENQYFDLSQVFSISHVLSSRRTVSYQVGVYGVSQPAVIATDYLVAANYRQNIHSDYLFVSLVPQIRYRRDNAFHAEHSMLFRVEMVFQG